MNETIDSIIKSYDNNDKPVQRMSVSDRIASSVAEQELSSRIETAIAFLRVMGDVVVRSSDHYMETPKNFVGRVANDTGIVPIAATYPTCRIIREFGILDIDGYLPLFPHERVAIIQRASFPATLADLPKKERKKARKKAEKISTKLELDKQHIVNIVECNKRLFQIINFGYNGERDDETTLLFSLVTSIYPELVMSYRDIATKIGYTGETAELKLKLDMVRLWITGYVSTRCFGHDVLDVPGIDNDERSKLWRTINNTVATLVSTTAGQCCDRVIRR